MGGLYNQPGNEESGERAGGKRRFDDYFAQGEGRGKRLFEDVENTEKGGKRIFDNPDSEHDGKRRYEEEGAKKRYPTDIPIRDNRNKPAIDPGERNLYKEEQEISDDGESAVRELSSGSIGDTFVFGKSNGNKITWTLIGKSNDVLMLIAHNPVDYLRYDGKGYIPEKGNVFGLPIPHHDLNSWVKSKYADILISEKEIRKLVKMVRLPSIQEILADIGEEMFDGQFSVNGDVKHGYWLNNDTSIYVEKQKKWDDEKGRYIEIRKEVGYGFDMNYKAKNRYYTEDILGVRPVLILRNPANA